MIAACCAAVLAAPAGAAAAKPKLTVINSFRFEGDEGSHTLAFPVVLSKASKKRVSVDYATAVAGIHPADPFSDYTPTQGTLTIKAKRTAGTIRVPITGDLYDEYTETFALGLSNPHGARLTSSSAKGFILDDDRAPTVKIGTGSAEEGDSGTTNEAFPVTLSLPSGKPIDVTAATVDTGTATAGTDYTSTVSSPPLHFDPGTSEVDFDVPVIGDVRYEGLEAFGARLVDGSGTVTLPPPQQNGAFGLILDDDPPPALSIDDVSETEGHDGGATTDFVFTVTLTGPTDLPASVSFTTSDGTATVADNDFSPNSGTLNFAPGETTKQITVTVNDDAVAEPDEDFTVDLSSPTGATISDSSGQGTIQNDDT